MSSGRSVLARLRRARAGAARYVAALFAVAYLSVGVAPCVAANVAAGNGGATEHAQHTEHAPHAHEHGARDARPHHGHEVAAMPAQHDGSAESCPHCALGGGAAPGHDEHASCAALEDLTNLAPQAKVAPPALAPPVGPAAFTLPPPLASPLAAPPWYSSQRSAVPLNVRHCVFLI